MKMTSKKKDYHNRVTTIKNEDFKNTAKQKMLASFMLCQ